MANDPVDVTVENAHGLHVFRPETQRGHEWLEQQVQARRGWWIEGRAMGTAGGQQGGERLLIAAIDAGLKVGTPIRRTPTRTLH